MKGFFFLSFLFINRKIFATWGETHNSFFIATDSLASVLTVSRRAQKKSFPWSNNFFFPRLFIVDQVRQKADCCLRSKQSHENNDLLDMRFISGVYFFFFYIRLLTIFCTTLLRIVKFNEKTQNGNSMCFCEFFVNFCAIVKQVVYKQLLFFSFFRDVMKWRNSGTVRFARFCYQRTRFVCSKKKYF